MTVRYIETNEKTFWCDCSLHRVVKLHRNTTMNRSDTITQSGIEMKLSFCSCRRVRQTRGTAFLLLLLISLSKGGVNDAIANHTASSTLSRLFVWSINSQVVAFYFHLAESRELFSNLFSPSKMVQFANLPDDCYFLIFVRLSTSTLLSCRRVSRAWLRNQQQVFRQRKVLILLQGNSPTKLLTDSHFQSAFISHGIDQKGQPMAFDQFVMRNQVNLCSFDQNVTRFLAKTFPNVDTLIIVHDGISSENVNNALTDLLQQYSSKVVALKMYFNYRGETGNVINPNIHKVIGQLNSMSALEHVTLESHNPSGLSLIMSNKDLNFLTRVKQFYYYSPHISKTWFDVLRQLEESTNASQLEHIGLGLNKWVANEPFGHWPLADRFTHFPYNTYLLNTGSSSHFEQSIGPFRCLTSFTILQNGRMAQPPSFLAKKLTTLSVHCPSLVHLKIIVGMDYRSVFVQPFDPSTIEPLQSVKVLDLAFRYFDLSQIDVQAKPFVHTFPNLVSIRIICHKVGFDFIKIKENKDVKFVNFFRQLKATLGRKTLRTVYCEESADLLTDFLLSY